MFSRIRRPASVSGNFPVTGGSDFQLDVLLGVRPTYNLCIRDIALIFTYTHAHTLATIQAFIG